MQWALDYYFNQYLAMRFNKGPVYMAFRLLFMYWMLLRLRRRVSTLLSQSLLSSTTCTAVGEIIGRDYVFLNFVMSALSFMYWCTGLEVACSRS